MVIRGNRVNPVALVILFNAVLCFAGVFELNKDNLDTFRKGKLLVVIYVDSPTCERCRIQFPFFVAASQAFPRDPEIFFTRTHDKRLVEEWGVTELPALMYYRDGIDEPDFFPVDVTVDEIIDEIARRLYGNFGGVERFYAVDLTASNFHEIVRTPRQSVLMLTYDKNSLEQVKVMESVAKLFRNDDAILICKLNVDKEEEMRNRELKSRDVPAVFWYSVDDKGVPKRFGGHISLYMETTFINEQTGLDRNPDGSMKPTSGRLAQYDTKLLENVDDIVSGDRRAIGKLVSHLLIEKRNLRRHEQELASYYVFLLDKIAIARNMDIVESQLHDIEHKLDEHDLLPKQEDLIKRKRNILNFFKQLPVENEKRKKEQREREEKERKDREEAERMLKEAELALQEAETKLKAEKQPVKTKAVPRKKDTITTTIHSKVHEEL